MKNTTTVNKITFIKNEPKIRIFFFLTNKTKKYVIWNMQLEYAIENCEYIRKRVKNSREVTV